MARPIEINYRKYVELAAEEFSQLLIQQVLAKKGKLINKKIESKYDKTN